MSGNRVEELEAKVRQLEATIDGLTDELVETKERLGAIEDQAGIEPEVLEGRLTRSRSRESEATESDDDETSTHESSEGDEGDTEETADTLGDDIIVA